MIADTEPRASALIAQQRDLAQASIAHHGGRYVVRGGAVESVEGNWKPQHLVVGEFPTMEAAHTWYRSPEYAEALKLRDGALRRRLIFVEGAPPG